jgi:hypothetical protein
VRHSMSRWVRGPSACALARSIVSSNGITTFLKHWPAAGVRQATGSCARSAYIQRAPVSAAEGPKKRTCAPQQPQDNGVHVCISAPFSCKWSAGTHHPKPTELEVTNFHIRHVHNQSWCAGSEPLPAGAVRLTSGVAKDLSNHLDTALAVSVIWQWYNAQACRAPTAKASPTTA